MNYYARFWNKEKLSLGSEKIVSGLRRNCLWEHSGGGNGHYDG